MIESGLLRQLIRSMKFSIRFIIFCSALFLSGCTETANLDNGNIKDQRARGLTGSFDSDPVENEPLESESSEWIQVIADGFGDSSQDTVPEMEVFEGYLYASTSPTDKGNAKLWRSDSGDPDSWESVTHFDPALSGDKSIHSFGVTSLNEGYIWLGTGNKVKGAMIYQSQDGINWTGISERGFGNPALTGVSPHMVVFQGTDDDAPYLYAGMGSHGEGTPGQVWRIPYESADPDDWELLVDFADVNEKVQTITYFYAWDDTLYFGTDAGGQLWESTDGVTFTENEYVGTGFGDKTNYVLSSFVVFDEYFYVTTTNKYGGQLWRSNDGQEWEQITDNAFGKGKAVNELRSLRVSFGQLWLTGYTQTSLSDGTPVWRSEDGVNFIQANIDGFGDSTNNGKNAVTIGFEGYQYFGGPNYEKGGQIWRMKLTHEAERSAL